MNKSIKWILLCVSIFISVIIIDQNVNSIKHPGGNTFAIKIINSSAVIVLVVLIIAVRRYKLQKQKK